eukprot:2751413-Amphidinium_carterae.1
MVSHLARPPHCLLFHTYKVSWRLDIHPLTSDVGTSVHTNEPFRRYHKRGYLLASSVAGLVGLVALTTSPIQPAEW